VRTLIYLFVLSDRDYEYFRGRSSLVLFCPDCGEAILASDAISID
jgi:hypothetical protein